MNTNNYLKIAKQAVFAGQPIFKKHFGHAGKVTVKGQDPRNLVTQIDLKIERLIRKIVLKNFPTHKIIGEEFGQEAIEKNDFYWAIDPIDGTNNYIQGVPICCISLALWYKNAPLVAVVLNPITEELYTAEAGKGAYLNGKKISVSTNKILHKAYGGVGWSQDKEKAAKLFKNSIAVVGKIRSLGSSTIQMCFVASGKFDFFVTSDIKFWDFAAAALMVSEAGGKSTEFSGKLLSKDSKEMLCSNSKLNKQLLIDIKKF